MMVIGKGIDYKIPERLAKISNIDHKKMKYKKNISKTIEMIIEKFDSNLVEKLIYEYNNSQVKENPLFKLIAWFVYTELFASLIKNLIKSSDMEVDMSNIKNTMSTVYKHYLKPQIERHKNEESNKKELSVPVIKMMNKILDIFYKIPTESFELWKAIGSIPRQKEVFNKLEVKFLKLYEHNDLKHMERVNKKVSFIGRKAYEPTLLKYSEIIYLSRRVVDIINTIIKLLYFINNHLVHESSIEGEKLVLKVKEEEKGRKKDVDDDDDDEEEEEGEVESNIIVLGEEKKKKKEKKKEKGSLYLYPPSSFRKYPLFKMTHMLTFDKKAFNVLFGKYVDIGLTQSIGGFLYTMRNDIYEKTYDDTTSVIKEYLHFQFLKDPFSLMNITKAGEPMTEIEEREIHIPSLYHNDDKIIAKKFTDMFGNNSQSHVRNYERFVNTLLEDITIREIGGVEKTGKMKHGNYEIMKIFLENRFFSSIELVNFRNNVKKFERGYFNELLSGGGISSFSGLNYFDMFYALQNISILIGSTFPNEQDHKFNFEKKFSDRVNEIVIEKEIKNGGSIHNFIRTLIQTEIPHLSVLLAWILKFRNRYSMYSNVFKMPYWYKTWIIINSVNTQKCNELLNVIKGFRSSVTKRVEGFTSYVRRGIKDLCVLIAGRINTYDYVRQENSLKYKDFAIRRNLLRVFVGKSLELMYNLDPGNVDKKLVVGNVLYDPFTYNVDVFIPLIQNPFQFSIISSKMIHNAIIKSNINNIRTEHSLFQSRSAVIGLPAWEYLRKDEPFILFNAVAKLTQYIIYMNSVIKKSSSKAWVSLPDPDPEFKNIIKLLKSWYSTFFKRNYSNQYRRIVNETVYFTDVPLNQLISSANSHFKKIIFIVKELFRRDRFTRSSYNSWTHKKIILYLIGEGDLKKADLTIKGFLGRVYRSISLDKDPGIVEMVSKLSARIRTLVNYQINVFTEPDGLLMNYALFYSKYVQPEYLRRRRREIPDAHYYFKRLMMRLFPNLAKEIDIREAFFVDGVLVKPMFERDYFINPETKFGQLKKSSVKYRKTVLNNNMEYTKQKIVKGSIKVMSWNVLLEFYRRITEKNLKENLKEKRIIYGTSDDRKIYLKRRIQIKKIILDYKPDIVLIQEEGDYTMFDELNRYGYGHIRCNTDDKDSLGILYYKKRFRLLTTTSKKSPKKIQSLKFYDNNKKKEIWIHNVHIYGGRRKGIRKKKRSELQMSIIHDIIGDHIKNSEYFIVGGDFNATPEDHIIKDLLEFRRNIEYSPKGNEWTQYNRKRKMFLRLDYMFYNNKKLKPFMEWVSYSEEDIPNKFFPSDHLPIITSFVYV